MSAPDPLRDTFDQAARAYRAARPGYPAALFDDLLTITGATPADRLLEIGCGPGMATEVLAARGFAITAVELGPQLAAEARRTLAPYPGVEVVTAAFEQWPGRPGGYDLVYAATAWHWLDAATRYDLAAAQLRPGGHLAVWSAGHAFPADVDPFFLQIQEVYVELGEDHPGEWPPAPPDRAPDLGAEMTASGRFAVAGVRRYVWSLDYTAEQYLALLDTFSGHIAMEPGRRDHLYAEIRRRIGARADGRVRRHWVAVLTVGRVH